MNIAMKRMLLGTLVCCVAVALATQANAAEPIDIIKKAVEANGGKKNLEKYRAMTATGKGTVNTQGMQLKYSATWKFGYPSKMRVDIDADFMGMNLAIVNVFNGKEGWQKIADAPATAMNADQIKALKTQMLVEEANGLAPLLDTKKYKIVSVGESDVKGKKAIGLNITSKEGLDVNFYFDKKTYMLVKQQYQTKNETGQDVTQAVFLSGYKKVQGVSVPMKLEIMQDEKPFVTAEFDEVTLAEKMDASTFAKP